MENENPGGNFWSRRRWLSRLTFTFLAIAMFLAWTGYRGAQTHTLSRGRAVLYLVSAVLAFVLFLLGTRERHRPRDEEQ